MGSLPYVMQPLLPRSGAVPPNAPIVLQGHIQPGAIAVSARTVKDELAVRLEQPPGFGGGPPHSFRQWLVHCASGEWPPGETVTLTVVRPEQSPEVIDVPIAAARDTTAPVFSSMSPPEVRVFGGPRQPSYESVVAAYEAFVDPESPILFVTLEGGGASSTTDVHENLAGSLSPPQGARTIDAITLTDLSGNSRRIESPCGAPRPARPLPELEEIAGTLAVVDGAFVATTDGRDNDGFSRGHYRSIERIEGDHEISMTATRLTDEHAMPIELAFRGGYFGVTGTSLYYLYEHAEHWTGWKPTPCPVGPGPVMLRVVQRGQHVEGYVNGLLAGSFTLERRAPNTAAGVAFKGPPGVEAKIRFRDFVVRAI